MILNSSILYIVRGDSKFLNQNWVLKFDYWIWEYFATQQLIQKLGKSNGGLKSYGLYIKAHFSMTPLYIIELMNHSIRADQYFIASHSEVVDHRIDQPFTKNEIQFHNKLFWVYIWLNRSALHSESIKILIQAILRLEVSKLVKLWLWVS